MNIKISNFYLDDEQQKIVEDKSKYLLVVAGAGSGKTLTILGKINYLIKYKKINKDDILCISFTKASSESLKEKIKKEFNLNMNVYTFHKLSLEIIKENKIRYNITDTNTLDNVIHNFIFMDVLNNKKYMKRILKYFKIKYKNKMEYIKYIENNEEVEMLEKLISTFIHLFKCNGYKLEDFNLFLKQAKRKILKYRHNKNFLIIVLNIYLKYEKYLKDNKEIDFDDMIIKATKLVKEKGINNKYKYIIIDEYQDTSLIRFNLIKEILNKTNSNLMVVGDDFQSIYRFTGCDLSLFLDFKKYFKKSKIMKIQNTYRNSQELIDIAGKFVMKNKKQIDKNLKSNKHIYEPIKIIYYENIRIKFIEIINKIYKETNKPILVLGRNNKDIKNLLSDKIKLENDNLIYIENKNIKMKYLTVHKSKGLEEENVILINLENKLTGFPNQMKDDKLLRFVSKRYEKYPFSEERRLFYVALTRTKNYVYILTPKKEESIFIKELRKDFKNKININL
ncbi:MAG: UvrD-helicase domain-containing protein [Bacilli bacterium]|nr:UvrD-helicase domain-containing protein [Bacilli bacterium]